MSILHPRWAKGGHGDLADAFTLALWQVCGDAVPIPEPELGTAQWAEQQRDERQRRFRERMERPQWMANGDPNDRGRQAHWRR